jgi:hypothetical protein
LVNRAFHFFNCYFRHHQPGIIRHDDVFHALLKKLISRLFPSIGVGITDIYQIS